eukprot:scaffold160950_cov23-Tisochrysis_lutea.AAC.1
MSAMIGGGSPHSLSESFDAERRGRAVVPEFELVRNVQRWMASTCEMIKMEFAGGQSHVPSVGGSVEKERENPRHLGLVREAELAWERESVA